jgi:hypothetical protein
LVMNTSADTLDSMPEKPVTERTSVTTGPSPETFSQEERPSTIHAERRKNRIGFMIQILMEWKKQVCKNG